MFSLVSGFVEYMCKQDEFHVLIIGLDKAGKTNVLEKLKTLLSDLNGEGQQDAWGMCMAGYSSDRLAAVVGRAQWVSSCCCGAEGP